MTNEKRAQEIINKYRFDFNKIPKAEIRSLIENEISDYQSGSSEYIRVYVDIYFALVIKVIFPCLKKPNMKLIWMLAV